MDSPEVFDSPEAIVKGIADGNSEAEKVLYRQFFHSLKAILRKRTGDEELSNDLCQEALLIVLQNLRHGKLHKPESLAAYLHNTAINLLKADIRKQSRQKTSFDTELLEELAESGNDPVTELTGRQSRDVVRKLLAEIRNERDRIILIRYYIYDQNKAMLCNELDIEPRHFDKVISRARKRFRHILESSSNNLINY